MADISKIILPGGSEYNLKDAAAQRKITASGVLQGDGSGNISAKPVDTAPTANSTNLVSSGGVKSALDNVEALTAIPLSDPATASIAAGKYVVYQNGLYRTNAAISSGETATTFASKLDAIPNGLGSELEKYKPVSFTEYIQNITSVANTFVCVKQSGIVIPSYKIYGIEVAGAYSQKQPISAALTTSATYSPEDSSNLWRVRSINLNGATVTYTGVSASDETMTFYPWIKYAGASTGETCRIRYWYISR